MKFVALVSGGKDSIYAICKAVALGHQLIALANLAPPNSQDDEIDSYCFQTIGHTAVSALAECLGVPLFRRAITGKAKTTALQYSHAATTAASNASSAKGAQQQQAQAQVATNIILPPQQDEVEDLFQLVNDVKKALPELEAVSSGAILSTYQRTRVENVCQRLGLVSLAYLWQREQVDLLREMSHEGGVEAILIKCCSMGLAPKRVLGKTIRELYPMLCLLGTQYGMNVCGEGGEYETFTLDCPLFRKRIVIEESEIVGDTSSPASLAPVAVLRINKIRLEDKPQKDDQKTDNSSAGATVVSPAAHAAAAAAVPSASLAGASDNTSASSMSLDSLLRALRLTALPSQNVDQKDLLGQPHAEALSLLAIMQAPFNHCGHLLFVPMKLSATEASQTVSSPGDVCTRHVHAAMQHLRDVVAPAQLILARDAFYMHLFLSDMKNFAVANAAYGSAFPLPNPPSRTTIGLSLPHAVAASVDCLLSSVPRSVLHVQSMSYWAPCCIGPYSQCSSSSLAVPGVTNTAAWTEHATERHDEAESEQKQDAPLASAAAPASRASPPSGLLHLAGQIGLVPERMTVVSNAQPREQTLQCFHNNRQILHAMDANESDALSLIVFERAEMDPAARQAIHDVCHRPIAIDSKIVQHRVVDEDDEDEDNGNLSDHGDDDDEERAEASRSKAQLSGGMSFLPMLHVLVPQLPRDALVELQLIAAHKGVRQSLSPVSISSQSSSSGGLTLQSAAVSRNDLLCITTAALSAAASTDTPMLSDLVTALAGLWRAVDKSSSSANLSWKDIATLRIYYVHSISHEKLHAALLQSFALATHDDKSSSRTVVVPAFSLLPVAAVELQLPPAIGEHRLGVVRRLPAAAAAAPAANQQQHAAAKAPSADTTSTGLLAMHALFWRDVESSASSGGANDD